MHPSRQVEREYLVRVFGEVTEQKVKTWPWRFNLKMVWLVSEDVVYAGGEGMNHTFYVAINEGHVPWGSLPSSLGITRNNSK